MRPISAADWPADVAVGEHQKLIEKIQGLLLLGRAPVGEIFLKNRYISPQPFPLLFTAGGLQNVGEKLLPAQAVHQADVVIYRRAADGRDYLVGVISATSCWGWGGPPAEERVVSTPKETMYSSKSWSFS